MDISYIFKILILKIFIILVITNLLYFQNTRLRNILCMVYSSSFVYEGR